MFTNLQGEQGGLIWQDTKWAHEHVAATFSFRLGGVSDTPYDGLNVGLHVGDESEHVLANRQSCCEHLGGNIEEWVAAEQVHGTRVHVAQAQDRGRGNNHHDTAIAGADGIVTNVPGIILVAMAADCVPILFYDPVRHAAGAAHSGWKGTVGHIAREVLLTMNREFGTDVKDVQVSLGPSIRQCCYEVNHVVREPVIREFGTRVVYPRFAHPGKYLLSLQACIKADLIRSGVFPQHIEDSGICTACHPDLLFSHRADTGRTGRQLGAIRLGVR